jgi:hypothetical protein
VINKTAKKRKIQALETKTTGPEAFMAETETGERYSGLWPNSTGKLENATTTPLFGVSPFGFTVLLLIHKITQPMIAQVGSPTSPPLPLSITNVSMPLQNLI